MTKLDKAAGIAAADPVAVDQGNGTALPGAVGQATASVLLVDDDSRNLLALEEVLREAGHRVVHARSGDEALKHLLEEEFAVILLDVQMPMLDGYETAALIRGRARTRHVPIIFVTAVNKDETQIFRGYAAGAVDYVFKPIDPVILRSKVAVFAELYRKTEEVRRQAAQEKRLLQENFRIRAEKLRSEQKLRRREEQQALVIRSLPLAVYATPASGALASRRFVSDNIERLTGFPARCFAEDEEFWQSRIDADDRNRVLSEFAGIVESGAVTVEYLWHCADGSRRWFLDQAVVTRDARGRPKEIVGTWLDITERKLLEQQLAHAQKMEAIGKLTGGIAHDFNNMLSIVIGNIELLQKHLDGEAAIRRAKLALEGALRCADMTQRLLTFARRQPLESRELDLDRFVRNVADLLRRTIDERIELDIRAAEGIWPIRTDAAQIEAALMNLALNARDAMPDGGRLTIEVANLPWAEFPDRDADVEPGDYVALTVRDTGIGMNAEVLRRAFEPFFTTKGVGQGTGLGLSTTYGFVKEARGHITIDSAPGRGTTVRIFLPRSRGGEDTASASAPNVPPGRAELVLIVEDDAEVREVAVTELTTLGYRVLEAPAAAAALDLLDRHRDIRLLLTDILMPGEMDGRALAREAVRRRPDLKVMYCTGFAGEGGVLADDSIVLLRKPWLGQDLAARLRAVLDGTSGSGPAHPDLDHSAGQYPA